MSINFDGPVGPETNKMIRELFCDSLVANDDKTFLLNGQIELEQKAMTKIANEAGQTVTVELNKEGEIKTMRDGTQYQVTRKGWRKISERT